MHTTTDLSKLVSAINVLKMGPSPDQPLGSGDASGSPIARDFAIDFAEVAQYLSAGLCARIKAAAGAHALALKLGLPSPVTTQTLDGLYREIQEELENAARSAGGLGGGKSASNDLRKIASGLPSHLANKAIDGIRRKDEADRIGDQAASNAAKRDVESVIAQGKAMLTQEELGKLLLSGQVRGDHAVAEIFTKIGRR
jgi:hypothetical protein